MDVENCSSCVPFPTKSDDRNNRADETHYENEDISEDFSKKLHVGGSSNGHLNGCTKAIYEESKNVDRVINGLLKYSLDRLAHEQCSDTACNCAAPEEVPEKRDETIEEPEDSNASTELTLSSDPQDSVPQTLPSETEYDITYVGYTSEKQMPDIMRLIQKDLSEPYSIYTYRYFIHNWPKLCFLAHHGERCVGAIVCKLDVHKKHSRRGYIAMLAVDEMYRKRKIGSNLVLKAIRAMVQDNADEVVLETEITNKSALRLYENLGFVRDKRLFRYYLNGVDALRLKLWLR